MSTYFVSVRISEQTINGNTYSDRRDAMINNIYAEKAGYWDEMTSFFIVTSDLDTFGFAKKAAKGLSAEHDLLIVIDPSDMSLGYFGKFKHENEMSSFFKYAQQV